MSAVGWFERHGIAYQKLRLAAPVLIDTPLYYSLWVPRSSFLSTDSIIPSPAFSDGPKVLVGGFRDFMIELVIGFIKLLQITHRIAVTTSYMYIAKVA